jgi:hypothetical protein
MLIRPVDSESIEQKVDDSKPQQILSGAMPDEMNIIAVHQMLELHDDEKKHLYKDDVKTLIEWAKTKTGKNDPMELKWAIRDLQLKVSTPSFGDAIKHLARFAYLDLEELKLKEEKRSFF